MSTKSKLWWFELEQLIIFIMYALGLRTYQFINNASKCEINRNKGCKKSFKVTNKGIRFVSLK